MNFLKPSKDKIILFLFMILAALVTAILLMFTNRLLLTHYYFGGYSVYYRMGQFIVSFLRYIIIGYLTIAFFKKKVSPGGEYYNIFKVVILLFLFSFLYQALLGYIGRIAPDIFFSSWVNLSFVSVNLILYYLLACVIYKFNKP